MNFANSWMPEQVKCAEAADLDQSHGRPARVGWVGDFVAPGAEEMSGKNDEITFEGCELSTLFREFASECVELAQTAPSPEKHALYLKMARVWHQMEQHVCFSSSSE